MEDYIDLNRTTYIPIEGMKKSDNIEQTVVNILSTTPGTPWRFRDIYAALGGNAPRLGFVRSVITDNVNGDRGKPLFARVSHGFYKLADHCDQAEFKPFKNPDDRNNHPRDLMNPFKRREAIIKAMATNENRLWNASSIHSAIGKRRCDRRDVYNTLTTGIRYPRGNPTFRRISRGRYKLNHDSLLVRECIEGRNPFQYKYRVPVAHDGKVAYSGDKTVYSYERNATESTWKPSDNRVAYRNLKDPRRRKEAIIAVMASDPDPNRCWRTSSIRNAIGRDSCGIRSVQRTITNGAHWPVDNPVFRRSKNGGYYLNYDNPLVRACIEKNASGECHTTPEVDPADDDHQTATYIKRRKEKLSLMNKCHKKSQSAHFRGSESVLRVGVLHVVIKSLNDDGKEASSKEAMRVFIDDRMLAILSTSDHYWKEWPVEAIQSVSAIKNKRSGVIVNAEGLQITLDTGHIMVFRTNAGDAEEWISAIKAVMRA